MTEKTHGLTVGPFIVRVKLKCDLPPFTATVLEANTFSIPLQPVRKPVSVNKDG